MFKKRFSIMLLAGILTLGMTGCGGQANNSNGANSGGEEKVKLTFGIWDKIQEDGMKSLVEKFNEKNPNIEVEVQVTPWDEYWTKMEGAVYGVPKDFDTIALVYNKEIFDEANVPYPDESWDWDKLVEVSKQLTNKEKGIYGFAAALEDQQGYLPPIAQAGGYVLKDGKSGYTDPNTIEGLQFYVGLANKYDISPTLAQLADTNVDTLFQSGKVAMSYLGSWRMSSYVANKDIADKFNVAVLPKGKERASIINGLSFVGNASTKHPEEVKKFLSFLASEEAQDLQASNGTAISARNGSAEEWVKTYPNHNVQVFLDMKEYSVPVATSLTKAKWGKTEREMIKKMMMGEITVQEGSKVIYDEMTKDLATE